MITKPTHKVGVEDDGFDCALVIKRYDHDHHEVDETIRIAVEDIPGFLRDVANHAGNALTTAARRLEVGHCETCANTGLIQTERHGRPWSENCPDCRDRWPSKPFANAPHIGRRND